MIQTTINNLPIENKYIETIIRAAEDKRARDILVMDIQGLSSIADYFIIASGGSNRQVKGIVDNITLKMKENTNTDVYSVEGYEESKWVLLDYTDIIVHIFEEEERDFYKLENLWSDAKIYKLEDAE